MLPRKDIDELFTPLTLFKACLALKRSADPRLTELYKATLERLDKVDKNGILIGRTLYTPTQIRAELDRPVELIRAHAPWSVSGPCGAATRRGSAVVDGGPPFLDAVFHTSMFYYGDDEANLWIKGELDKLFVRDPKMYARGVPLPATFPVSTSDLLMFRSYDAVTAVATRDRVVNGRVVRARRTHVAAQDHRRAAPAHQHRGHRRHRHEARRAIVVGALRARAGERVQHPLREPAHRLARPRRAERLLRR